MVDGGPGQSESVIDLTIRRREISPEWKTGQESGWLEQPADLLSMPFLIDRLSSESQQVGMWAAYQLVDRWQEQCAQFIDRFWESPHEEILESAISLIGKYRIGDYAFPLMRVFNDDGHPLRQVAGVALGRLKYEPVARGLERWFTDAVTNREITSQALECATEGWLQFGPEENWSPVFSHLEACHHHHAQYAVLFRQLCLNADTPSRIGRLAEAYGRVRGIFNDVQFTHHLVHLTGRGNLIRFFQTRLGSGYPLDAIYRDCLKVLGFEAESEEVRGLMDTLAGLSNDRESLQAFLPAAEELLDHLRVAPEHEKPVQAMLRACRGWLENWDSAILKVRELEYHLMVSLPLSALLNQAEAACLANPKREALRITRIYQSPMLTPHFMVEVLKLIGSGMRQSGFVEIGSAPYAGWVRDEEKDALWRLYTNQLEQVDYPLEQVLPQPWEYPVAGLMHRLEILLLERIDGYISSGRAQAVDYCLEVFRRAGTAGAVEKLLPHFEQLINRHYHGFVEIMTHLPDVRFLQPLVNHYRVGEGDLLRLIRFICDVHDRPHPELEEESSGSEAVPQAAGIVRLLCRDCGGAYEYKPELVYVDEERIEQRQIPTGRDVWTPHRFQCKKCGAPVPFDPDERFLNDLFAELLANRLFPSPGKEDSEGGNIRMIQFPVFQGNTLNPAHFLKEMERLLEAPSAKELEVPALLELGRFQMEIGESEAAKQTLQRILAGPGDCPLAVYFLGILAFQEKNLYEARVHFSRLVKAYTREDFPEELDNPVDMAHHYLKLLDKREFKRSQFHLISS